MTKPTALAAAADYYALSILPSHHPRFRMVLLAHMAGYRDALHSPEVQALRDAIRATLGHYALFENEPRMKLPKYIVKCEDALVAFDAACKGEGSSE